MHWSHCMLCLHELYSCSDRKRGYMHAWPALWICAHHPNIAPMRIGTILYFAKGIKNYYLLVRHTSAGEQ